MAPRTPADIGRDIKQAEQRIVALKAELGNVPPKVLEIPSVHNGTILQFAPRIAGYEGIYVALDNHPSRALDRAGTDRLRAWLNHYYPEAS